MSPPIASRPRKCLAQNYQLVAKQTKSALCLRSMETYSGWKKILSKSKILALGENGGGRKAASLGLRVHKGTSQSKELTRQRNPYTEPTYSFKSPAEWYRLISRPLARFLFDIRIKVETTDEHPQGAPVTSNEVCVSVCGPDSIIKGLA